MAFFNPIILEIEGVTVVTYPESGIDLLLDKNQPKSVETYMQKLFANNSDLLLSNSNYCICLLWSDESSLNTDVWIFKQIADWHVGAVVDVKNFKNFNLVTDHGVTAGDGLLLLGTEESYRRECKNLSEYLKKPRPQLPAEISVGKDFYED